MDIFGTPEYGLKTAADETYPYRVVPKRDLGDDSEVGGQSVSRPRLTHLSLAAPPSTLHRRCGQAGHASSSCSALVVLTGLKMQSRACTDPVH